ncbi:hypothetical protein AB0D14_00975 [Streptomyces sp. NPDC048484]|uniref:hypothetical protein n=1 Tax=Streptomyces sp. NPDC048484 TaxID=3155146 RepID=UPI00343E41FA
MGSLRLALCAGSVVAAALTPALTLCAYAGEAGISVTPSSPAPGTDIQVRVRGCGGATGTAASKAFVADALLVGQAGVLLGETRVRSTLTPGTYDVRVTCDSIDDKVRGTFTVADKQQKNNPASSPASSPASPPGSPPASPHVSAFASARTHAPIYAPAPASAFAPAPVSAPASPVAPVHAGGGGTTRLTAAEAQSKGPGIRDAVVGLVLAGGAAVAVAVSSARRRRGRTD